MQGIRELWHRFIGLFRTLSNERAMQDEMQHHIDLEIERNLQAGMSEREARTAALRKFGNIGSIQMDVRASRTIPWIEHTVRDLHTSARSLRKAPGFVLMVTVTLGSCIGAQTAVLSALYGLVIQPLPVQEPQRLVQLFNIMGSGANQTTSNSSWNQYAELQNRTDLFEGIAIRNPTIRVLNDGSSVRRVKGQEVTAGFFDVMGVGPVVGRFFRPEEATSEPDPVVVLTQSDWENVYGADPDIIGKHITFGNSVVHTVVGVAPRNLEVFDHEATFYVPFTASSRDRNPTTGRYSARSNDLWLRLKEGVDRDAALEQIRETERRWYDEVANADARDSFKDYKRFEFDVPHPLKGSLYLLACGSLLIFLAGCFNVMNLLLSRMNQKRHEMSLRRVLGAGTSALRRLMLIESALLMLLASGMGIVLAWTGIPVVTRYVAILSPGSPPIELDWAVTAGMLALMMGVAVIMGTLPLEILEKAGLLERSNHGHRTSTTRGLSRRLSNGMVVGQVAIAFVLLIGTGLLVRSFQKVLSVDTGFDVEQIVQGRIDYMNTHPFYPNRADAGDLKQRIYDGMQDIPGVESVSLSMFKMFGEDDRKEGQNFRIIGQPIDPAHLHTVHYVSARFFTTMGIPIIEGRNFNSGDDEFSVIVDELFAERYFGDRSPIGAEMYWSTTPAPAGARLERIVGVAARANLLGLEERDGVPLQYQYDPVEDDAWEFTILVRSSRPSEDLVREMRAKLREIDPRVPFSYVGPVAASYDRMLMGRSGITVLLASFAGLALLLSVAGVYAVQAYDVLQRQRELAIRIAVGATPPNIIQMILRQGLQKVAVGVILGVTGALVLSRFLSSLLFDVPAMDIPTYMGAVLLLVLVMLAASFLPAFRATQADLRNSLAE